MIEDFDLGATILRPGYYMQNDLGEKERILGRGVYGQPLGNRAVLMTDTRDLAEVAALSLLRRQEADGILPRETFDVVDPTVLTGDAVAGIWAEAPGSSGRVRRRRPGRLRRADAVLHVGLDGPRHEEDDAALPERRHGRGARRRRAAAGDTGTAHALLPRLRPRDGLVLDPLTGPGLP